MARTPKNHNKGWTKQDVDTLKKMASRRPIGIIASTLGRTEAAIRNKAHEEGFSMNPPERSPYNRRPK